MSVLVYRGALPDGISYASEIADVLGLDSTRVSVSVDRSKLITEIRLPITLSTIQEKLLRDYLGAGFKKIS